MQFDRFCNLAAALFVVLWSQAAVCAADISEPKRPNVVLIITDDQGWGDLGFHGNDKIRTPNLDRLSRESVVLKNFYVSPVCTPTRASLLTGRYNYRTGAIDTFRGRALMHSGEVTLAEMLRESGYRTGIFGKWHLGDNYPLRAMDQGFDESLTLWGGGLVQWADPPQGNAYLDPWLLRNGREIKAEGYCSDVYTDAALEYIDAPRQEPFFVYLAYNAPHTPLQVRDEDWHPYRDLGLDETTAKVYGMVTNIDANVGRLLKKLDDRQLAENTIVVFLTDNGPQQPRYNGPWRGLKGTVYEGGIHVPCFIRWPAHLDAGHSVEQIAAHIDLAPTLLAACNVKPPASAKFDGRNLLPLLQDKTTNWAERHLFFQWHRGDVPERYRAFAVRGDRYKLVQAGGVAERSPLRPKFELYDLSVDPSEKDDLAAERPEIVEQMKHAYDLWFDDVSATRGYAPPAIHVGTTHENPVRLSRQDLRGFSKTEPGGWQVKIEPAGYDITLRFDKAAAERTARLEFANTVIEIPVPNQEDSVSTSKVQLAGAGELRAWLGDERAPDDVKYVELRRRDGNPQK